MEETKVIEQPNSIKWSINAKGNWSGECKVYAQTIEEALEKSLAIAKQMEVLIKEKNGGKDGK